MSKIYKYPNLSNAPIISVDTETFDPYLKQEGPGWARGVGNLLGVSIATDEFAEYYPLKHQQDNAPWESTIRWLRDTLGNERQPKVGANILYDIGWLAETGIDIKGPLHDVLAQESLLHPGIRTTLDIIAKKYLGLSKEKSEIDDYNRRHFPWSKDARENLYKMPTDKVATYAVGDAVLPLKLYEILVKEISIANLYDVYDVEMRLLPVLLKMRQRGLNYDEDKARESRELLSAALLASTTQLYKTVGEKFNILSPVQVGKILTGLGINLPKTDKGNPKTDKETLEALNHPLANAILDYRKLSKLITTFIDGVILEKGINGKIYPTLNPLIPITGRFSCSQPNGQFIPSRDGEMAPIIRGMFVPENGYPSWIKMDYSQIEYRMLAHYSKEMLPNDPDSELLVHSMQDRDMDYHDLVRKIILDVSGLEIPRAPVKNINFGLIYGMTINKLIQMITSECPVTEKTPEETAKEILNIYIKSFPVPKKLMDVFIKKVRSSGQTRTLLNRRVIFDKWEHFQYGPEYPALPLNDAIDEYGARNIRRAGAYKGINYTLQGSAADYIKKAMVLAHEEGIFNRTGYPTITVHDELDFPYHPDLKKEFKDLKECSEHAIPLHVPMVMGTDIGPDWGHVKEVKL